MRNYPNMPHCMFNNTNLGMGQLLEEMQDIYSIAALNLSREELIAFKQLYEKCQLFVEQAGQIIDNE